MSDEDFPPSHFLEQMQTGDAYDDSLFDGVLMDENFNPILAEDHFLEYPDESTSHESLASAEPRMPQSLPDFGDEESLVNLDYVVPASGSQPARLSIPVNEPRSSSEHSVRSEEEISSRLLSPPANGSLEGDGVSENYQPQDTSGKSESGGDHSEVPRSHTATPQQESFNDGQKSGLTSESTQELEAAESRSNQKETKNIQSLTSPDDASSSVVQQCQTGLPNGDYLQRPSIEWLLAHNDFASLIQQQEGLADGLQGVGCNAFDSQEWNDFPDQPGDEDIPVLPGSEEQKEEQVLDQTEIVTQAGIQASTEQHLDKNQEGEGLADDQDSPEFQFDLFNSQAWQDFLRQPGDKNVPVLPGSEEQKDEQNPTQTETATHDGAQAWTKPQLDENQEGEGPADDQWCPEPDFTSPEWQDYLRQPVNYPAGPLGLEEQNVDQTPNQIETVTHEESQKWIGQQNNSLVSDPNLYGNFEDYGIRSQNPVINPPRPAVDAPGFIGMAGPSSAMNRAANLSANNAHAAIGNARSNDSEGDRETGTVPIAVAHETYEGNNPQIVENPTQKGWGRTGMRNGQQVWFNDETGKWRKLLPLHPKPHGLN